MSIMCIIGIETGTKRTKNITQVNNEIVMTNEIKK